MCLILFAYNSHPRYPLIIAANRDEFYSRPTTKATFWEDNPDILAGRDLRCGGTWLGVSRNGRIAALANHRERESSLAEGRSRGLLVVDMLKNERRESELLEELNSTRELYNGYSLIFGTVAKLCYFSNRTGNSAVIAPGIHGQSNDLLDTKWPKVESGKQRMASLLSREGDRLKEELLLLLSDQSIPEDSLLPETGLGLERERLLSSIFVTGPDYGTRSSTIVLIDSRQKVDFIERTYNGSPRVFSTAEFTFNVGNGVKHEHAKESE